MTSDDPLDRLSTDALARVVAALEGRPPGKLRSRAYGIARIRRALDRSGRTAADALESAGVRPRAPLDTLLLGMTEEELDRALTLTDEDMAALEASGAAALAQLLARHGVADVRDVERSAKCAR